MKDKSTLRYNIAFLKHQNMASRHQLILHVFVCGLVCLGAIPQSGAAPEAAPPDIRWVPEMARVTELQDWTPAAAKDHAQDRQRLLEAWKEVREAVERELTAAQVIALSKWSRTQMKDYSKVPSLEHPDFQIRTAGGGEKKLFFEATLQTLPTHSPLVTRWLKLFVVYDVDRHAVSQVIITIRGEVQE